MSGAVYEMRRERGLLEAGWLRARFSFSFGGYVHPRGDRFGPVLALNDDEVQPGTGFPMHPHRDLEIFMIPLEGAIAHEDSLGNRLTVHAGEVLVMRAGRGIRHSQFNASATALDRHLQLWLEPGRKGLRPGVELREVGVVEAGEWRLVASVPCVLPASSVIPASPSVIPASPSVIPTPPSVIPAEAGIQSFGLPALESQKPWLPTSAGMTTGMNRALDAMTGDGSVVPGMTGMNRALDAITGNGPVVPGMTDSDTHILLGAATPDHPLPFALPANHAAWLHLIAGSSEVQFADGRRERLMAGEAMQIESWPDPATLHAVRQRADFLLVAFPARLLLRNRISADVRAGR